MTPDPSAILEQLDRMLTSDTFATAGRHSRLLRYLVERTLAGEGDQLKEYVLGTEVFDRADSYDPRLDSIVRVEVRRLRARLEDYYGGAGAADPVVIRIPKGSYAPEFNMRETLGPASPPAAPNADVVAAAPDTPPVARRSPTAIAIAAALTLAIAILAAGVALNHTRQPAQASSGPGLAVLPFEDYTMGRSQAPLLAELTDRVTVELARLGTVSVASRTSAAQYASAPQPVRTIGAALGVDFVVEGSASMRDDRLYVDIRLVDAQRDRKVWVSEYVVDPAGVTAAARAMARDAAGAALERVNR